MDVLELLSRELQGKHWSVDEKVRYVYLRVCQFFVFDYRYKLSEYVSNKKELLNYLQNRNIDLTNVTDKRIICHPYSKQMVPTVMKELFSLTCTVEASSNAQNNHVYPVWNKGNLSIKMDGTDADILRTKMNLTTKGYYPMGFEKTQMNLFAWNMYLREIDQEIGYIQEDYEDAFVQECTEKYNSRRKRREYSKMFHKQKEEDFVKKIYLVKELYERYPEVPNDYFSARFCVNYWLQKLLTEEEKECFTFSTFFKENDDFSKEWDIQFVWRFQLKDTALYFMLKRFGTKFVFDEVSYSEILKYSDYKGEQPELVLKNPNARV